MGSIGINGPTGLGNSLQQLLMCDEIVPGEQPSYQICKTIYTLHPLGKKMADSPIDMAQSQPREIAVQDGPEEVVTEQYLRQWEADNCDKLIANTMGLSRVYGISSVAMIVDGKPTDVAIDPEDLWKSEISFNVFDPLNTAGSLVLNQNPNAANFMKTQEITVNGKRYHRSRSCIMLNEAPIYIDYTQSAFGFVGRSVYQRALFPLKSFVNTLVTDDMVVRKVGVLVAKMKPAGSIVTSLMMAAAAIKRSLLKEAQTDNVISISPDEDIESLNLQNLDAPYAMARRNIIENIATAEDMPAKILLQETFAEGFGEGTEDAKYVARYIDRTRIQMQPLYNYFDPIIQRRAWNPEFYKTVQKKYPEYEDVPYNTAFYRWANSFKANWPSLLTEPPSEMIRIDDVKLRAVIAMMEVLLPLADPENRVIIIRWAAENFNELKLLFQSPLILDEDSLTKYLEEVKDRAEQTEEGYGESGPKAPRPFADSHMARELTRAVSLLPQLRKPEPRPDKKRA
jgi:hypothetical protein